MKRERKKPDLVWVVHGFGAVTVFRTEEAALRFQRRCAQLCQITRAPVLERVPR
jgi:hypothetical protein